MRTGESNSVEIHNPQGAGPALLLCEHASHHFPDRYAQLGLSDEDARSHAAWDPGARQLALLLSSALDAPLVAGRVSRLVYDCNRPPEEPSAMTERSETINVPGNHDLSDAERAERIESIYVPFCRAADHVIAARKAQSIPTVLVTVHSFTPIYFGKAREVEIGILNDTDSRMADAMLALAPKLPERHIQRNAPYGPQDGVTHSLKLHGIAHGLPNVMLEIRNDLLQDDDGCAEIAGELLGLLGPALARLANGDNQHV